MCVEGFNGWQAPSLPFFTICLTPDDGLPVRSQYEARTGAGNLEAVAARLVNVQEKRLLDGMFVRARFHEYTLLEVRTDAGVSGLGSSYTSTDLVNAALGRLRDQVIGEVAIEPERIHFTWLSASEGAQFSVQVRQFVEQVKALKRRSPMAREGVLS